MGGSVGTAERGLLCQHLRQRRRQLAQDPRGAEVVAVQDELATVPHHQRERPREQHHVQQRLQVGSGARQGRQVLVSIAHVAEAAALHCYL